MWHENTDIKSDIIITFPLLLLALIAQNNNFKKWLNDSNNMAFIGVLSYSYIIIKYN